VATARVQVVMSDQSVRKIGMETFGWYRNLVKVTAPFVEVVGEGAFIGAYNLCHVSFSPDVVVQQGRYSWCSSLEVLAASVGFELDNGDRDEYARNDATVGITRLAKWRNKMDDNKEYYKSTMVMLELANSPLR